MEKFTIFVNNDDKEMLVINKIRIKTTSKKRYESAVNAIISNLIRKTKKDISITLDDTNKLFNLEYLIELYESLGFVKDSEEIQDYKEIKMIYINKK